MFGDRVNAEQKSRCLYQMKEHAQAKQFGELNSRHTIAPAPTVRIRDILNSFRIETTAFTCSNVHFSKIFWYSRNNTNRRSPSTSYTKDSATSECWSISRYFFFPCAH